MTIVNGKGGNRTSYFTISISHIKLTFIVVVVITLLSSMKYWGQIDCFKFFFVHEFQRIFPHVITIFSIEITLILVAKLIFMKLFDMMNNPILPRFLWPFSVCNLYFDLNIFYKFLFSIICTKISFSLCLLLSQLITLL